MTNYFKIISNFFLLLVFYGVTGIYILQIFELLVSHRLELFLQNNSYSYVKIQKAM